MSTVASNLLKFQLKIDPVAKGTSTTVAAQRFKGSSDGTTITATSNVSGTLIRITSAGHGLSTGQYCTISGVVGTTEANNTAGNPAWKVTVITSSTFDLVASTYTNAWVSGGTVVGCFTNSVDGAKFTRQRLLEMYNEARMVLFNSIYVNRRDELNQLVYSTATTANITWTYGSPNTTAPKPSGYLRLISLMSPTTGVPVIVLDNSLLQTVQLASNPNLTQSATNILGFEIGSNFLVPVYSCAGTGTITYYGITAWTWFTDVFGGSTTEIFNSDLEPILIEIACAIADEQSNADTLALAKTLLNKKGN